MFVSRKKVEDMGRCIEELQNALQALNDWPYLISVEREKGRNVFKFLRNGEVIQIETASTMKDDLPRWKEELFR